MDKAMMGGNCVEVLDLTHDDGYAITHKQPHDYQLVSRYDDGTHNQEHQQPTPKHERSDQVNFNKRVRSDSFVDREASGSSKKRRIITGGRNGCFTTPIKSSNSQPFSSALNGVSSSSRRFKAPSTPPPTRKSRTMHKKHFASVTKAPRGPSRYTLAARAAVLSSTPEPGPEDFVVISDNDTPPRSASQAFHQAVKSAPSEVPSISSPAHGFWDDPLPFTGINASIQRSQQAFTAGLCASITTRQPSNALIPPVTETQITRDSDEGWFAPPSPLLPSKLGPDFYDNPATGADTTFSHVTSAAPARGIPVLTPAAFRQLQSTSAKMTYDDLPQLPHRLTHPPDTTVLVGLVEEIPDIMQRFEERWEEKFRDVRDEFDTLAQFVDEQVRGTWGSGGGVQVD